ncbi:hypothetical protein [Stenotrophomonas sp. ATCM1_4]|uniref:hypothetical protein n=1 Tax=Stenotrophomonas sp. ATCM1_4 TaxID=2259330 RepID=UPI001051A27C|nr:hypothetical protein [Stenotrophomonas sp. ATCM1_4]
MKSWQGRGLSGTVAAQPLNRLREQQLRGRQNRDTVSAMSSFLATAVNNNNNRNNLRANNRARPMRDCDQS